MPDKQRRTDKLRATERAWYAKNRDKVNARKRAWRKANPQKTLAYNKKYYAEQTETERQAKRVYAKQWRQTNKDSARRTERSWRYNVSTEEQLRLEKEADGKCFLCKKACAELHLDHDHSTGRVRHLLCPKCNLGLVYSDDDGSKLKDAITYLDYFEERNHD